MFRVVFVLVGLLLPVAVTAKEANHRLVGLVAEGRIQIARASWWGFDPEDSTEVLQAAIDSGVRRLIVDNVGQPWIVRPITLAGDQTIIFSRGVEVVAKRGEFKGRNDSLFTAAQQRNITLSGYGATLRMHRLDYDDPSQYEKAEWRHILNIRSSTNIRIYGLTLAESGGDGIYLGKAVTGVTNKNIHVKDVVCDRNYRQGISVITAEDLLIENTIMRDTAGTPPQAGIDFEPNHPDERLANVVMRNCLTENNKGDGYEFYLVHLYDSSEPLSIRIENCRSINDNACGVRIVTGNTNGTTVKGTMVFVDCTFEGSGNSGITISNTPVEGAEISLVNCCILDPAAEKPLLTPILFQNRRGATEPVGGFKFDNCLVRDSLERNLMSYTDMAAGVPLQAVRGTITVERGGKSQKLEITPKLLADWIPMTAMKQIPRLRLSDSEFRPVSGVSHPYSFDFARLRGEGRFILYAQKGDEVNVLLRHEQVGKLAGSDISAVVTGPSGRQLKRSIIPFRQEAEVTFTARETGLQRLTCDPNRNSIRVISSSHPINLVGEIGPVSLIHGAGDYYFWVPSGVREFGVRVAGEGAGEAIRAMLLNPEGRVVQEVDNTVQIQQFEVELPQPSKGETWRLRLARPSAMAWEDHSVDLRGIPPLLAPSEKALLVPVRSN